MDTCVVFLCNKAYFSRFVKTCELLITNGKYNGPICLVIGDDLLNDALLNNALILKHKIIIKHFPDIVFPPAFTQTIGNINNPMHKCPVSGNTTRITFLNSVKILLISYFQI